METTATILHADLDAFYASVEQLLDPSLRGKPIAVGGGVVLAASYEARAFGVRGGMPGRRARELCPQLHLRRRPFQGVSAARRCRDRRARRFHAAGRAHLHRRGLCRRRRLHPSVRLAGRDRGHDPRAACAAELGLPISVGVARTKHLAKIASQVAKPDGLVVVDPDTELAFLHDLPVELMWGVGPVTKARLAEDRRRSPSASWRRRRGGRCERLLGPAAGEKLAALAWNRDPREIRTHRRAHSAGAQSALGMKPAESASSGRRCCHLADRVATRLRAKSRPGRTVTVRVRFADLRAVTRSVTLDAADLGDRDARRDRRGAGARRARRSPATRRPSRCWRSRCRISRRMRRCSSSCRSGCRRAAPPRHAERAWRARWPTAPSTGSAIASAGRRSATARSRWGCPAAFPTRSANWRRRSCDDAYRRVGRVDANAIREWRRWAARSNFARSAALDGTAPSPSQREKWTIERAVSAASPARNDAPLPLADAAECLFSTLEPMPGSNGGLLDSQ